jgi:hypothetical protein
MAALILCGINKTIVGLPYREVLYVPIKITFASVQKMSQGLTLQIVKNHELNVGGNGKSHGGIYSFGDLTALRPMECCNI